MAGLSSALLFLPHDYVIQRSMRIASRRRFDAAIGFIPALNRFRRFGLLLQLLLDLPDAARSLMISA